MWCNIFTKIPCRLYWHDLYESTLDPWIWYRPQSWAHAVAVDKDGYVYLSGYYKDDQDNVNRILLKYFSNGTPVTGDLIIDIPWYEGVGTYENLGNSWWTPHKLLVDNDRKRLYVLTATIPPGSELAPVWEYNLWLHCHDLETGEKRWTAFVGHSSYDRSEAHLRTGLDIDSEGNVWTVIEDYVWEFYVPGGHPFLGVKVRKWSGENGTNIGTYDGDADYAHVFTINVYRELVVFGVRKRDNKKIFAFREKPTGPPAMPHDLTVVIYDADCRNFIDKFDYLKEVNKSEFPLPPPEPGATEWQSEKAHPYFSGGFLDANDRLQIAGCYIFSREEEVVAFQPYTEFIMQRFLTVLTFDLSGLDSFPAGYTPSEFIEQSSTSEPSVWLGWLPKPEADYGHNIVAKPGPRDNVLLSFFKPYYGCFPLIHLVEGGKVVESVRLCNPQSGNYGSPNCIHRWTHFATDFIYIPGFALGVAGFLKKRGYHANDCPWQGDHYKAIVAYYGSWKRIAEPRILPFKWFDTLPQYQRFWPPFNPDWFKVPPEFPDLPPRLIRSGFRGPSYLVGLYRQIQPLVSLKGRVKSPKETLRILSSLIEEIPEGGRFNSDLREETSKALRGLLLVKGLTKANRCKLIESLNSIELDWRYPHAITVSIKAKDRIEVQFGGAVSLRFESVNKSGKCSLEIRSGVPALVKELEPAWPVSSYVFEFTGNISKGSNIEVGIHIGNRPIGGPGYIPHILQWDGKSYKDITTGFNPVSGLVMGRTDRLSPLAVFGSKGPLKDRERTKGAYKSPK